MDYVEDHTKLVVGDILVSLTSQHLGSPENDNVVYTKVRKVSEDNVDMYILHMYDRNDSAFDVIQQAEENVWDVEPRDIIYKLTDDEITRYVLPEII